MDRCPTQHFPTRSLVPPPRMSCSRTDVVTTSSAPPPPRLNCSRTYVVTTRSAPPPPRMNCPATSVTPPPRVLTTWARRNFSATRCLLTKSPPPPRFYSPFLAISSLLHLSPPSHLWTSHPFRCMYLPTWPCRFHDRRSRPCRVVVLESRKRNLRQRRTPFFPVGSG